MIRKGISPIIASVLLLAVTLAVVGIFSGWAPELVEGVTESTENSTYETIACNEASIEFRSAYYDGSSVTVSLRNSGSEDLSDISLVAYGSDEQIVGQNSSISIESGNIVDTGVSVDSNPSYLESLSGQCGSVTATTSDISQ